ncbi:MAG: class I SAM-dependent methyltransferase [Deltaproteobacteria bacterium]|nr:class I SAM-dependent methyltransferase [Deltaproteobacteria bacterium]
MPAMRSPLFHCPVCDASLDAGPRGALANQGFVRCECCSHEARWQGNRLRADGSDRRVTAAEPAPSLDACDRRMSTLGSLGVTRGRLLDIGCGTGRFLLVAKARQLEVAGIESDEDQRAQAVAALGIGMASSLDTLEPEDLRFDVITVWGALCTVDAPLSVLAWAAERMRPGALLGLSAQEPETRTQHRFTRQSISLCALRAGFEPVQVPARRSVANRIFSALRPGPDELELWARRR